MTNKTDDVSRAQALMLWCRKEGIAWEKLTLGTLTIEGSDMRSSEGLPKQKTRVPSKPDGIMRQYGAELLNAASDSEGMTSVVDED